MPRSMTSCNGLIAKKVAGRRRLRAAAIISTASSLNDPDDDLDLRRTPVISSFLEAADRLIYILPSIPPSPRRSRARAIHTWLRTRSASLRDSTILLTFPRVNRLPFAQRFSFVPVLRH